MTTTKKRGRPALGEEKRKMLAITLPPDQLEWLEAVSKETGKAKSLLISELLGDYMKHAPLAP